MQSKSDTQLLREYVEQGVEHAFTEIVNRHTNLVYSVAVRHTDSPDMAAEITQSVFIGLVRGGRALSRRLDDNASLAGWLCRSARNISLNLRRDEFRRHSRERQATENLNHVSEDLLDWEHLRPVLDDAMSELGESDHDALVMRFFNNQDFQSVGRALGVADDTAQKRVSRALDKLREHLSRRGISSTATALSLVLSANAVQAAPAGLAVTISTAALAQGTGTTLTLLKIMTAPNLKTVFVGAVIVLGLMTPAAVYQQAQARLHDHQQALQLQSSQLATAQSEKIPTANERGRSASPDALSNDQLGELLRLRSEVGRLRQSADMLRRAKAFRDSDALLSADQVWPTRENRLKQWLAEHPSENIPEISRLPDKTWLDSIFPNALETDDDYRRALTIIRANAESPTLNALGGALHRYAAAQNGQWPSDVSQLQPYLSQPVDPSILNRYAIVPASTLVPELQTGEDWILTENAPIGEYDIRSAIGLTNSLQANSLVTNRWTVMR